MNEGVVEVLRGGSKETDLGCQIDMNLPNVASTPKKAHSSRLKFSIGGSNVVVSLFIVDIKIIYEKLHFYFFV